VRDSVPDSPIADALLALKHAVVHTPHSATSWTSPGIGQLSYGTYCQSPTPATSYQSPVFSASPIYDRTAAAGSPTETPFPFPSSHHHHHHHHHQHHHQPHRYHSADSQDSSSPALTSSASLYTGGMHRPYRRDMRDFSFGSSFVHDAPGFRVLFVCCNTIC